MSKSKDIEIEENQKYKDTFVSRSLQIYFKTYFFNGIRTLFSPRIAFFTILFLIGTSCSGFVFFIPFFDNLLYFILTSTYFSIMIGLIITGIFSLKTYLQGIRILIFFITSFCSFLLIYYFNLIPFFLYVNEIMIFSYIALFSIGFLIVINTFHQSWYAKISMIGKSPNDIAYKNLMKGLLVLGFACSNVFLYFYYFQRNIFTLTFYFIGVSTSILMIGLFFKSNYKKFESFEYFAMTLLFYFSLSIIFIFTLFFVDSILQNVLFVGLILLVSFLGSIQVIKPSEEFQKKLFKKQKISSLKEILRNQREKFKKEKTFKDEDDIIIINIEDDSEKEVMRIPKSKSQDKKFGSIKEKVGPKREGFIILFLGINYCIFSLIYSQLNSQLGIPLVYGFTIRITWYIFNEYLIFSIYTISLIVFIAYFASKKIRKKFVNETTVKNAFLEFLRLIDKDERSTLLKEMADTIREIMISGIIDLFDPDSDSMETFGDTIKDGIDFFKRLFTGRDQ